MNDINKEQVINMLSQPIESNLSMDTTFGGEANASGQLAFDGMKTTAGDNAFYGIGDTLGNGGTSLTGWDYWQNYYYPQVIRESYPVYIRERSEDKGKQAFEILKMLQDKKLLKMDKVSDFIEVMDSLIKVL